MSESNALRPPLLSRLVPVLMLLASVAVLARLGPDAPVPMHFNAGGVVDRWAPAWQGLFFLPLVSVGLLLLFIWLPRLDPRGHNLLRSAGAMRQIGVATQLLLAGLHALMLGQALAWALPVRSLLGSGLGLLLMVLGNQMGKLRQNYTVGIRTPWTLADERVWDQTHRFGGRLMVLAGLAVLLGAWWAPLQDWQMPWLLGWTLAAAGLSCLKSWLLWRARTGGPTGARH